MKSQFLVIIWLKIIFYDKYIIKKKVFLYAFHQKESENAKISIEKSAF